MSVTVLRAGFLASIQDLGRFAQRAIGVSLGGALDPHALAVANLLVGNEVGAAGIEATLGQLRVRFDHECVIAWTGGAFRVRVAADEIPPGHPALVRAGEELLITAPQQGGRAWLAISGGIDVPMVLGSRSTDLRSGFGGMNGRALRDGDVLEIGERATAAEAIAREMSGKRVANWSGPIEWVSPAPRHPFLRFVPGADWMRLRKAARNAFAKEAFTVQPESDRMGVRLVGPQLHRAINDESEAVVPGTIQVPPSGQPIILLGDCQTIGGYPKIAHVITIDLPSAAQLRAGDEVRFVEVTLAEAQGLLVERARDLARFRVGLALRTGGEP